MTTRYQRQLADMWVSGDKDLNAKLKAFTKEDFAKTWESAARTAENIVKRSAQKNAQSIGRGNMAKAIITKSKRYGGKAGGNYLVIVGVSSKYKAPPQRTAAQQRRTEYTKYSNIAHLVERGTKPHIIKARPLWSGMSRSYSSYAKLKDRRGESTKKHLLAVPIGGGKFKYLRKVRHPGASKEPFLVPAQERNNRRVVALCDKGIARATKRIWEKKYANS